MGVLGEGDGMCGWDGGVDLINVFFGVNCFYFTVVIYLINRLVLKLYTCYLVPTYKDTYKGHARSENHSKPSRVDL